MKPVGRVQLSGNAWWIEAEPHVMIRLKRVFERVDKKQHGVVALSDTLENARELLWFLERFPMEVTPREYLERRATEHKEKQLRIEKILASDYTPTEVEMALPPREYQRAAAELFWQGGSLLLGDDLGLGKTVSAITAISRSDMRPAMVVTLTHLPMQWEREIKRFAPKLRVHILKKSTPYDLDVEKNRYVGFPDVIIGNYHKLSGWADTLGPVLKSVVFDEVQELRHAGTAKYEAAQYLANKAKARMALSATPIFNYGGEMFSVMNVVSYGSLGTRDEFTREWCSAGEEEKAIIADPKAFGQYLRSQGLMLRRTRADVGRELPGLSRFPHTIEADPKALDAVNDRVAELAKIILSQGGQGGTKGFDKFKAAEEISYLMRQATGVAKAPYVADFVRLLIENGEKVVLYGWHHEVYRIWAHKLAEYKPAFYTGSESVKEKEESKRRFVEGETPLMILSLRAGAGLDGLQHVCKTVVFGELDWSPGVHEQCIGRVHRDGQLNPVFAYFLIADSGSDPVVAGVLGVKQGQLQAIRDPNAGFIEQISVDGDSHIRKLAEFALRKR